MNPAQAKKTVLVSMLILAGIAVYRQASQSPGVIGLGIFRRLWGTGVVGVFLSLTADFAPTIAGPFAALVVLGSLTTGGDTAIQNLLGGLTKTAAANTKTTTSSTTSGGTKTVTQTTATGP